MLREQAVASPGRAAGCVARQDGCACGTFGPAGYVQFATDAQGNGLYRRRKTYTLESALIHEGIHALGQHTHADGETFPRPLVQRCMDPTHTDW